MFLIYGCIYQRAGVEIVVAAIFKFFIFIIYCATLALTNKTQIYHTPGHFAIGKTVQSAILADSESGRRRDLLSGAAHPRRNGLSGALFERCAESAVADDVIFVVACGCHQSQCSHHE